MANKNNVIGLAMQLDVSDLKSGIQEVNKSLKSSKDEFNNAVAGMDKWSKTSDGLTAKLKQLNNQLNGQKKIVAGYEAEIQRVSELEGDHSTQLEELNAKLRKAQTEVKKTESSIQKYGDSLADVVREEQKQNSELGKLTKTIAEQQNELNELNDEYKNAVLTYGKNSREAKDLAKQINTLSKELSDNVKKSDNAEKALQDVGKSAEQTEKEIADLKESFSNLGAKAVTGIKALGAGLVGLGTAFFATAEGTREFRTNIGKLETSFTQAGLTAKQAEETYKSLYAVVADEGKATEASAMISELAKNQEDLTKWVDISTGVYAKFGDSLPIENLAEASNETAKTGKITGGLADALNWVGVAEDEFQAKLDKTTSEQERNALITDTLTKLYGESSKQYKETNKDIIASNQAQAELASSMAEIGKLAEPIMTEMKLLGASILESILPVVQDIIPIVKENLPLIITLVASVGGSILAVVAAMKIYAVAVNAAAIATNVACIAMKALNVVMALNPIGLIVVAITALIVAFGLLWAKSEAFREFWKNLWSGVVDFVKVAVEFIKNFFVSAWDGIKKAWSATGQFFKNLWEGIKQTFSAVKTFFINMFSGAWDGIKKIWNTVIGFYASIYKGIWDIFKAIPSALTNFFKNAWTGIKNAFTNPQQFFNDFKNKIIGVFTTLPSKMLEVGTNLVQGLWNGIEDMTGWIVEKIKGFGGAVLGGVKKFFGINSPSKVMAQMGDYLVEGMAQGIEENTDKAIGALDDMGGEMMKSLTSFKAKMEREAKTIELGGKVENPFAKWSHAKLNAESLQLDKTLKDIGQELIANGVLSEDWNTSAEKRAEREKILNQLIKTQSQQLDIYNAKLQKYGNGAVPDWVKTKVEQLNKSIEVTTNEANELSEAMKFDSSIENSASAMTEFSAEVQAALDKASQYGGQVINGLSKVADNIVALYDQVLENDKAKLDEQQKLFEEEKELELAKTEENINNEMLKNQEALNAKKISEEEFNARKIALEDQLKAKTEEVEKAKQDAEKETLQKKDALARKQFKAQQANDIAQALIAGALAIVQGFAQLGPIGGGINAVLQAVITGTQVGIIASKQYVPMLAKGGIVDSPTMAMIGEAGKEAVIPLENNTGWMTKFAEQLQAVMQKDLVSGVQPVNNYYQGESGGKIVNYNYQQTINAPTTPSRIELYRDTKNLLALRGV